MIVAAALAAGLAATAASIWLARRAGVMDRPGALKVQRRPVPRLGGLGVLAGLSVATPLAGSLVVPPFLASAMGTADDVRGLPAWARLVGAAGIGGVVFSVAPTTRGPAALSLVAVVALTVALLNGMNMVDGLDALAGGVGAASALGLAAVLHGDARTMALVLAAALVAFLVFNLPPARVYLGDGGAYLVGTSLAVLVVLAWARGARLATGLAALAMVAYPLAELGTAVWRRLRAHTALFGGDRRHLYDQLVDRGWRPTRATAAVIAAQAVCSGAGICADRMSTVGAAAVVSACVVALIGVGAAGGFLSRRAAPAVE